MTNIVAYLSNTRIVNAAETAIVNTPIARHWRSSHYMIDKTIEQQLEERFPVESMPRLYNKDLLPLQKSSGTVCQLRATVRSW
jgi:hypothetical protein